MAWLKKLTKICRQSPSPAKNIFPMDTVMLSKAFPISSAAFIHATLNLSAKLSLLATAALPTFVAAASTAGIPCSSPSAHASMTLLPPSSISDNGPLGGGDSPIRYCPKKSAIFPPTRGIFSAAAIKPSKNALMILIPPSTNHFGTVSMKKSLTPVITFFTTSTRLKPSIKANTAPQTLSHVSFTPWSARSQSPVNTPIRVSIKPPTTPNTFWATSRKTLRIGTMVSWKNSKPASM